LFLSEAQFFKVEYNCSEQIHGVANHDINSSHPMNADYAFGISAGKQKNGFYKIIASKLNHSIRIPMICK
jgi:hypothetical protein